MEAETHIGLGKEPLGSVCFDVKLRRRRNGSALRLTLFDEGLLRVRRSTRRRRAQEYTVDVRFVDPTVHRTRQVAWRCLGVGAILSVVGGLALWLTPATTTLWRWVLPGATLISAAGLFSLLLFVYRTGDTLRVASLHGRAEVLRIEGGLRIHRRLRPFVAALQTAVSSARSGTRPGKPSFLRDEMREHQRLKIEGVLSTDDFELAKIRILSAHD